MQQWEYKVWQPELAVNTTKRISPDSGLQYGSKAYEEQLDRLGKEGWELVGVRADRETDDSMWVIHWFKRLVKA